MSSRKVIYKVAPPLVIGCIALGIGLRALFDNTVNERLYDEALREQIRIEHDIEQQRRAQQQNIHTDAKQVH